MSTGDLQSDERRFAEETGIDPASWLREGAHPAPSMLMASREGVLPELVAHAVSTHIAACRTCTMLLDDLLDEDLASPTLAETARIGRALPLRSAPKRQWRAPAAIAATLAVAALGLVAVRNLPTGSSAPQTASPSPVAPEPTAPARSPNRIAMSPAPLRLPIASALVWRNEDPAPQQRYLEELGEALKPYREGKYKESALLLQSVASHYPQSLEAPFYTGVAHLLSDDAVHALEWLAKKPMPDDHPLHDDQLWYRAAALERTGHWPEALELVRQLCRSQGAYQQRACLAAK